MDKKIFKIVNELRNFKRQNKIEKLFFFGSRAYGKPHKYSDIDLIVVSKNFRGKGLLDRAPKLYMQWNMDYPVDFLCYTPKEFNKLKKQVTIVREAVREGIEI